MKNTAFCCSLIMNHSLSLAICLCFLLEMLQMSYCRTQRKQKILDFNERSHGHTSSRLTDVCTFSGNIQTCWLRSWCRVGYSIMLKRWRIEMLTQKANVMLTTSILSFLLGLLIDEMAYINSNGCRGCLVCKSNLTPSWHLHFVFNHIKCLASCFRSNLIDLGQAWRDFTIILWGSQQLERFQ